jgi:hypothetical protein
VSNYKQRFVCPGCLLRYFNALSLAAKGYG